MTDQKLSSYLIPQKRLLKANSTARSQRNNQSLPSIGAFDKDEKINQIRNEIGEGKAQITLLKARINTLKWQKFKNDKNRAKHYQEIEFIQTVRSRFQNDKKYKRDLIEKRELEMEELKKQTIELKQKMARDRELSISILAEKKIDDAEEERIRRKEDEDKIRRFRSIQLAEKQLKAKRIKQEELEVQKKMQELNQSRMIFALENHRKKIERSKNQKKEIDKILQKLRKQQELMVEDCKKSQADMLSSLYQLESLNPQKSRKRTLSSSIHQN